MEILLTLSEKGPSPTQNPIHGPSFPALPPDQFWQRLWLQPEGLILGAQSTDGRFRGHQGCEFTVSRESDARVLQ